MILRSLVVTQYQRVTDRQTDAPPIAKWSSSIAERDKNVKIRLTCQKGHLSEKRNSIRYQYCEQ